MNARHLAFLLLAAASCFPAVGCSEAGEDITLQGAGATFPAPLYKRWFLENYRLHPEIRVNYQPIGSGAGIRQFTEHLIHFGASDAAMTDQEMAKIPEGVQLVPMTAGSIAISYNLPGASTELRLSRKALLGILWGNIDTWNDPAITLTNKGVDLPEMPITFVRRSEGSGTTFAFTNHLSAISPEWKKGPGVGKSITWPVGIGAKGNAGVASLIHQTPGALGYVETGYAELTHMPIAALENRAGAFIKPTIQSSQAALEEVAITPNLRMWIPDPRGADAYPIVTYTWILCFKSYPDPKVAETLKKLLTYCLTDGQQYSAELGYVPLPASVSAKVLKALNNITP
jgi:phosphate transport system substrate-binding protein